MSENLQAMEKSTYFTLNVFQLKKSIERKIPTLGSYWRPGMILNFWHFGTNFTSLPTFWHFKYMPPFPSFFREEPEYFELRVSCNLSSWNFYELYTICVPEIVNSGGNT